MSNSNIKGYDVTACYFSTVGCDILRNGQIFNVPHGDFFVNVDNCERCLCNNGEATMCEPSVCVALQRSPPECVYEDESYNHGERFQVYSAIKKSLSCDYYNTSVPTVGL